MLFFDKILRMNQKTDYCGTPTDPYRNSRILYCIEATLEYFIAIMVGETYLAKIALELGASTALTGVLYAFVSLGSAFQIFAILLSEKTPVKRWVTPLHILNQIFFTLIYAVPLFSFPKEIKIVLFAAFLLLGHILNNVVTPSKINWFMSLVENTRRGRFTAKKEIMSLLGGMIFSFIMSSIIDRFEANGNLRGAFLIGIFTVGTLMILHSLTLILSKEKPVEQKSKNVGKTLKKLLNNKSLLNVIGVSTLWYVANYMTIPFYGSYRINELGFTMTFCSILSIVYSIVRSCFSTPMGRLADKKGFANMLSICFSIQGFAYLAIAFSMPTTGKIAYPIYYILNAIAMAGINSAQINLIYDYVDLELRTSALALSHTISGLCGFLMTLAISPLVTHIQKNGNTVFGIPMYAQQLLSLFGIVMMVLVILYIKFVLKRTDKKSPQSRRKIWQT